MSAAHSGWADEIHCNRSGCGDNNNLRRPRAGGLRREVRCSRNAHPGIRESFLVIETKSFASNTVESDHEVVAVASDRNDPGHEARTVPWIGSGKRFVHVALAVTIGVGAWGIDAIKDFPFVGHVAIVFAVVDDGLGVAAEKRFALTRSDAVELCVGRLLAQGSAVVVVVAVERLEPALLAGFLLDDDHVVAED
jgi:hypothetical protein